MHDDQIHRLLRTLEDEREPDPAFAEHLYSRLTLAAQSRRASRSPMVLMAAALFALLVAGIAIGSGLVRLPLVVEPGPSASAGASATASATASASHSPVSTPTPSSESSSSPSVAPDPAALTDRVLWAEADGLRIRAEPADDAEILSTLRRGQLMSATGSVTEYLDTNWYEVRIGPGPLSGWVAGGPDDGWLRLVDDGVVTFRCDGCGEAPTLVSVDPSGDALLASLGPADELIEWRWSPDGTRLAATRGVTTLPSRVVILDEQGTELEELGVGATPVWSPDGSRLAWMGEAGLVVSENGGEPVVVDLGNLSNGAPFWSPDGTRFGVIAAEDPGIMIDPPVAAYVVPAEGGLPERVTEPGYLNGLAWAPDGSRLAYTTVDLSGEEATRAFIVDANGGEPELFAGGDPVLTAPTWSPGGSLVAFVTPDGLAVANGDGTELGVLVANTADQTIWDVQWSPSGRWLLYGTAPSTGGAPMLWIAPVDGSSPPARVSPSGAGAQQADWQPVLLPLP